MIIIMNALSVKKEITITQTLFTIILLIAMTGTRQEFAKTMPVIEFLVCKHKPLYTHTHTNMRVCFVVVIKTLIRQSDSLSLIK